MVPKGLEPVLSLPYKCVVKPINLTHHLSHHTQNRTKKEP